MTRMLLTQKFSLRERCTSWSFCGSINFVHLNGTVVFTSPLHHSVLILIFLQGNLRGFLVFRAGCKLLKYICVSFSGWADLSKRYTMDHLQCFICHCWMRLLLKNQQYKRIHDPWIPGIGADRWVYCTSHKYVRWGPPPTPSPPLDLWTITYWMGPCYVFITLPIWLTDGKFIYCGFHYIVLNQVTGFYVRWCLRPNRVTVRKIIHRVTWINDSGLWSTLLCTACWK